MKKNRLPSARWKQVGSTARRVIPRNDCRVLIWVDSAPERKAESKAYIELKEKITAVTAEIEHFQQVTLPEFERWHAQTFGVLLTEQRSLQTALDAKLALIEEVRLEQWRGGGSEAAAYRRVQRARSRREAGLAEEIDEDQAGNDATFDAMFREAIRNLFGVDPEVFDAPDRATLEKEFRRKMNAKDPSAAPPPGHPPSKKPKPPTRQQAALEVRCKQIYRLLVMRLHPDTGTAPSAQARHLWHDLQDAWQRRDLERLELLQAIVELQGGGEETGSAATSLERLRRIVRDLAKAWRDVQKHRRALARHPATQLAEPEAADLLAARIRSDLRADIRDLQRISAGWIR